MDYEAVGNSCVFWGTVLVAVGAFLFSAGWFLLGIYKQTNEWLENRRWFKPTIIRRIIICASALILLIAGSVMVGRGGSLTTKGWNIMSLGDRRSDLIRAVTQEWLMNTRQLHESPMRGETHYVKKDGGIVRRPFRALRTYTLQAVLSSGLWDYGNRKDKEWLEAISEHEIAIQTANRHFRMYDDNTANKADPNEAIRWAKELQRLIPEKDFFKALLNTQGQLLKLIWSEYSWAIETQMPEAYKLLRQRLQEKQ